MTPKLHQFPSVRAQQLSHPTAKTDRTIRTSPLAVLCMVACFASSGIALAAEAEHSNLVLQYGVLIAGPASLAIAKSVSGRKAATNRESRRANLCLAGVGIAASLSAIFAMYDPALDQRAIQSCVLKTGGLVFIFLMIAATASTFTLREVSLALLGFALFEAAFMLGAYVGWGVKINRNAVGVRLATSGLLLYSTLPTYLLRFASLITTLGVSFSLQCRTSMMATLGAFAALVLENKSRRDRSAVFLAGFAAMMLVGFFGADLLQALRSLALSNLRSNHPVARFFLNDKHAADVFGDFLDRRHVWEAMMPHVAERPFWGHGTGAEFALFRMRSHNAYLSILVEGGVILLTAWLVFYGLFVHQLLDKNWLRRVADTSVGRAQVLLFSYLVLAGSMESSGMGSVSTPNNIIFVFLTIWAASRVADTLPEQLPDGRINSPSKH